MTSRVFAGDHADDSGGSAERDDGGEPRGDVVASGTTQTHQGEDKGQRQ